MPTTSIPVEETGHTGVLSPEEFDDVFSGLPQEMREINADRVAGEPAAAPMPPGLFTVPEDRVLLVNIKFPNQKFYPPRLVPDAHQDGVKRSIFAADRPLAFVDGHLVCTRSQADLILAYAPHVKEEPREGPILEFKPDKFQTRNTDVYAEYATRWAENQ